jgi:DNA polymerase V
MFVAAEDYADQGLDLNERLIRRPAATFFMKASGASPDAGVFDGDLLVVDRGEPAVPGRVVVAAAAGELTVRRLPAGWNEDGGLEIWGVVTWVVRAP